jgi:glycosyltransferase involved in cell wall biosynthesis
MPLPEVSIVVPVYNEEACLPLLGETLDRFLATFGRTTEVILVNDGSQDRSQEILEDLARTRPHFRVLKLRANVGQTPAMAAGLEAAQGAIIVFMDADLQNDPEDIPRLLEKLEEGYDVVSGWRKDRRDRTLTRKLPSRVANAVIGLVTGVRVHDYGCTLKAYRASVVKPLHLYSDMHRFLPALCSRSGGKIGELVVKHHPRLLGQSKYGLDRIFKVVIDLVVIKLIVTFSDRPMHYFGLVSLVFLSLTGITTALWIWNLAEVYREEAVILPALIVLFLCSFLYFLFIGLLADLIINVSRRDPLDIARASMQEVPS